MILPINEIEITAKSLEEAIAQAAQQLEVDPSLIEVEVIEENKKLFGRGHIRIKAKVIESSSEKKTQKTTTRNKKGGTKGKTNKVNQTETPEVSIPEEAAFQVEVEVKPTKESSNDKNDKEVIANEDDATEYLLVLREILKLASIRIKAQLKKISGRHIYLSLEGEDIGLLLTRRAETLNSLQYLLNVIVFRKTLRATRVILDAGEYRQKREDSLCRLARQVAKEVVLRGEEAILDPLPAFERRVIHNHLQNVPGIRTYSEGDEPNRYVVIAPAE